MSAATPATTEEEEGEITKAYKEAKGSRIYDLSQLAFGSLLVAYLLGFIPFVFYHATTPYSGKDMPNVYLDTCRAFVDILAYPLISVTFAFLTASLYISYHSVILARPSLNLSYMRWDFVVSLAQGVLFGFSLNWPFYFPFWVALALLAGFLRQEKEYLSFREYLLAKCSLIMRYPVPAKKNEMVHDLLDNNALKFWFRAPGEYYVYVVLAMALNVLLGLTILPNLARYTCLGSHRDFVYSAVTFIAAAMLCWRLSRRSLGVIGDAYERVSKGGLKKLDKSYATLLQQASTNAGAQS